MRKLYITSNYLTSICELDENDNCKIPGNETISISEQIRLFKKAPSVKTYGIIRAVIQERDDTKEHSMPLNGWKIMSDIIGVNEKDF